MSFQNLYLNEWNGLIISLLGCQKKKKRNSKLYMNDGLFCLFFSRFYSPLRFRIMNETGQGSNSVGVRSLCYLQTILPMLLSSNVYYSLTSWCLEILLIFHYHFAWLLQLHMSAQKLFLPRSAAKHQVWGPHSLCLHSMCTCYLNTSFPP